MEKIIEDVQCLLASKRGLESELEGIARDASAAAELSRRLGLVETWGDPEGMLRQVTEQLPLVAELARQRKALGERMRRFEKEVAVVDDCLRRVEEAAEAMETAQHGDTEARRGGQGRDG